MRCNAEELDKVAANSLQQEEPIRYCPAFVTLSSRGLGHRPFTAVTRVRIPLGSPLFFLAGASKARCADVADVYQISQLSSHPIHQRVIPSEAARPG